MRNTNKKGFTIVELVIVVAVIAILAAVLIPTFSGIIRKANESKDTQLVKHLNTAIAADVDGDKTMSAAIAAAAEFGFDLSKIDAKVEGNEILWDSVANVFCYLNNGKVEYISEVANKGTGAQLWIIDTDGNTETHDEFSSYVANVEAGKTVVANHSIDTTACEGVNVEYKGANNVDIYTNGGVLTVDAPSATVNHYGDAAEVYVNAVSENTFNLYAKVGYLEVAAGQHVVLKSGSKANAIFAASADDVDVENGQPESIVVTSGDKEAVKTGATLFAGGVGTEAAPYLIENAEQMMTISTLYDESKYYKVADGIITIDGSGIGLGNISLNGCFDGNGVTFTGINNTSLFVNVRNDDGLCEVGNFTTGADSKFAVSSNGTSVIRSARTNAKLYNITVHGYVEGTGHVVGFVSYVYGEELTIEDCYSDANLVCIGGEPTGGFVGHAFSAKIYINNSEYAGNTYAKTNIKRYLYVAQNNTGTVFVNDTQISDTEKATVYNSEKCFDIAMINPAKGDSAYTFEKQTSGGVAVKAIISIEVRSGYSDDNDGYPFLIWSDEMDLTNESGTITIDHKIINKIILNADGVTETSFANGVYNIYHSTFVTAPHLPKINVTQYDANGNIVAIGTYNIDAELVLGSAQ